MTKKSGGSVVGALVAIAIVVGVCCVIAWASGVFSSGSADDNSTVVPTPAADEAQELTAGLSRAYDTQHICYGWVLRDGTTTKARGSNFGPDTDVTTDKRCQKYAVLTVSIRYTSASSESEDSASALVSGSPELPLSKVEANLGRDGLTATAALLDDPVAATARAALTMPLLLAETGAAPAVPPPSAPAASGSEPPLPAAGSDFWRDRAVMVSVAGGLVALAVVSLLLALSARRRQRRAASSPTPARPPTRPARAGPAGRAPARQPGPAGQPSAPPGNSAPPPDYNPPPPGSGTAPGPHHSERGQDG